MKLADICRICPEVFVSLTLEQQRDCLADSGLLIRLDAPITSFSISESRDSYSVMTFNGPVLMAGQTRRTITYSGDRVSFLFDC